jgi:hypothetical protein
LDYVREVLATDILAYAVEGKTCLEPVSDEGHKALRSLRRLGLTKGHLLLCEDEAAETAFEALDADGLRITISL